MALSGSSVGGYILGERLAGDSRDVAAFRASGGVVVKIPIEQGPEARDRFLAMAAPRAGLPEHPHVVRTRAFGVDKASGSAYLAQDFVPGPTFEEARSLSLWHRVRCGLEAAMALEHLHSMGVAHGGPVLAKHFRLDEHSRAVLVDLGGAYSGGLPPLPEPGMQRVRAAAGDVLADVRAYGAVLRGLLGDDGLAASVTLRSIVQHCPNDADADADADSLRIVIDRLQAWVDSYPAALFEASSARRVAPAAAAQPAGLLEIAWSAAVLALSLAAVVGAIAAPAASAFSGPAPPASADRMALLPSGLRVDAAEVTVAEYLAFARHTRRRLPPNPPGRADLPAVNVTALDAEAYCAWAGKRLPTEAQWMEAALAARGGPSGPANALSPVDASSSSQPHRMFDNAAEWVAGRRLPDLFAVRAFDAPMFPPPSSSEDWRRIKGGSYLRPLAGRPLRGGIEAPARYSALDVGFRCVSR